MTEPLCACGWTPFASCTCRGPILADLGGRRLHVSGTCTSGG